MRVFLSERKHLLLMGKMFGQGYFLMYSAVISVGSTPISICFNYITGAILMREGPNERKNLYSKGPGQN